MAIGTIILTLLAIYNDSVKNILAGPKLRIDLSDPSKERIITMSSGKQCIYFHLK